MLTPILSALVIAPALKAALGGLHISIDYTAFVAVGTVGLLVPLATTFAGLSVIVDRESGARASCSPRRSRVRCCSPATWSSLSRSAACRSSS
jgi:hypothetical protein